MRKIIISALFGVLSCTAYAAEEYKVDMKNLTTGKSVGYVTVTPAQYGVVFTPHLKNLEPGLHGFHVHANPSCGTSETNGKKVLGGLAGGHYDPDKTNKHSTPWSTDGHKGDLPALYVDQNGNSHQPVLSPKLTMADLKGRSLMIHVGGDNHSDHPAPLGGGGGRIVCGVF